MNVETGETQVAPESVSSAVNVPETAESTYGYDNAQQALSSNENNTQARVYGDYYYNTSHADPQRQANELTYEQSAESGVAFGQATGQVASYGKAPPAFPATSTYQADYQVYNQQQQHYQPGQQEMPAQQQFAGQPVMAYPSNDVGTSVLGSTSESPPAIIINSSKAPIVADNSTFGNYESCGSDAARPLVNNPDNRAMNFTDNNRATAEEARYNPNMQQTETINTAPAHQWHERREKLPTTLDRGAFGAERQTNRRAAVVNTAEIQNARKLLFLQRRAAEEKQLGQVNQRKESSAPQQQPQQQVHQAHHLYRLQQMQQQQQQHHLGLLTPDSSSTSSRQFLPSPMSAISSTGSAQPTFPQAHVQEAAPVPNPANPMHNLLLNPFQQLLIMQAWQQQQQLQQQQQQQQQQLQQQQQQLQQQQQQQQYVQQQQYAQQQQYVQQPAIQPYQPNVSSDFFDNWQKYNQQKYDEALKENTVWHKDTDSPRRAPRKRKRQMSTVDVVGDKENASVNSSERALVIDESTAQPSNVQLMDLEPKLATPQGQVAGGVVGNSGAAKTPASKPGHGAEQGKASKGQSLATVPTPDPTGMWLNDNAMFHEWLQQSVDHTKSGMVQCENPGME